MGTPDSGSDDTTGRIHGRPSPTRRRWRADHTPQRLHRRGGHLTNGRCRAVIPGGAMHRWPCRHWCLLPAAPDADSCGGHGALPPPTTLEAPIDARALALGSAPRSGRVVEDRGPLTRSMLTATAWRASRRLARVHHRSPMTGRTVPRCEGHHTPLGAGRSTCDAVAAAVCLSHGCSRTSTNPEHYPLTSCSAIDRREKPYYCRLTSTRVPLTLAHFLHLSRAGQGECRFAIAESL